jgi:hypothetical protein
MEESNRIFKVNWIVLIGVVFLFYSCVVQEEQPIKTEIPVDTFWMYSSNCLRENFAENFIHQQSMRISNPVGLEVLASCSVDLPEIDFNEFFLLVTRVESSQIPNFRDQGLYLENETELVYEINIDLSDFQGIGIIYCFGVIPNEFSQKELKVKVYEN